MSEELDELAASLGPGAEVELRRIVTQHRDLVAFFDEAPGPAATMATFSALLRQVIDARHDWIALHRAQRGMLPGDDRAERHAAAADQLQELAEWVSDGMAEISGTKERWSSGGRITVAHLQGRPPRQATALAVAQLLTNAGKKASTTQGGALFDAVATVLEAAGEADGTRGLHDALRAIDGELHRLNAWAGLLGSKGSEEAWRRYAAEAVGKPKDGEVVHPSTSN
jgi:hypothetical protein